MTPCPGCWPRPGGSGPGQPRRWRVAGRRRRVAGLAARFRPRPEGGRACLGPVQQVRSPAAPGRGRQRAGFMASGPGPDRRRPPAQAPPRRGPGRLRHRRPGPSPAARSARSASGWGSGRQGRPPRCWTVVAALTWASTGLGSTGFSARPACAVASLRSAGLRGAGLRADGVVSHRFRISFRGSSGPVSAGRGGSGRGSFRWPRAWRVPGAARAGGKHGLAARSPSRSSFRPASRSSFRSASRRVVPRFRRATGGPGPRAFRQRKFRVRRKSSLGGTTTRRAMGRSAWWRIGRWHKGGFS